jgi:hypothetical protein
MVNKKSKITGYIWGRWENLDMANTHKKIELATKIGIKDAKNVTSIIFNNILCIE